MSPREEPPKKQVKIVSRQTMLLSKLPSELAMGGVVAINEETEKSSEHVRMKDSQLKKYSKEKADEYIDIQEGVEPDLRGSHPVKDGQPITELVRSSTP